MEAGANKRKPSRHGQGGGAGQADGPGPRKPPPQGGDVSDPAEAGGAELALSHARELLNIDQWKKEAAKWVSEAPSKNLGKAEHRYTDEHGEEKVVYLGQDRVVYESRELREYFKGDCAAGIWFRFDPVTDQDPSLSAPGSLRTIIKEYAESRGDISSFEHMRELIEGKGLEEWKALSPIVKSRFIDELWRVWGQGDTSTVGFRLLDLEKWLYRFAQSEKNQNPPKKKLGRPSMRGATHAKAPKEVGKPEYQFGMGLVVLWNRFVEIPKAMDGHDRDNKNDLDAKKPQTGFEELVDCCIHAAMDYAKVNGFKAFFPAFRTIRDEGLEPALRDFRRILREDHREELEVELRDWR